MARRRRRTARSLVGEALIYAVLVIAMWLFLTSGGPAAIGRWSAGQMFPSGPMPTSVTP